MQDPFISFVAWQQLEGEDFTHTTPGRTPLPTSCPQEGCNKGNRVFWWLVVALIMLVIVCSEQDNTIPAPVEDYPKEETNRHALFHSFGKTTRHPSERRTHQPIRSKAGSATAQLKRETNFSKIRCPCCPGKLEYDELECNELENSELERDEWR